MGKDQLIGLALLIGSIIGIIVYGYLLYNWATVILQITVFLIVAGALAVVGWIGYTLTTTLPPKPIEELTKDEPKTEEPKAEENRAGPDEGKS